MEIQYVNRQPGIIKQGNSALNRKADRSVDVESVNKRAALSINLSHKNLF